MEEKPGNIKTLQTALDEAMQEFLPKYLAHGGTIPDVLKELVETKWSQTATTSTD